MARRPRSQTRVDSVSDGSDDCVLPGKQGSGGGKPLIAAIYARKSTEQNVADEEKSVTRQVERARDYATRKGWTVDDAHI